MPPRSSWINPFDLVRLADLMALTRGRADVVMALVDGPVALDHPDLAISKIRTLADGTGVCVGIESASCRHGTSIAGVLVARRGSQAPAIAPDCTLLIYPIFSDESVVCQQPSATPQALANAIVDCVDAGAWVINLSAALTGEWLGTNSDLRKALDYTVRRGVLVIAAAGNQGAMAGSAITCYPWVISVVAYAQSGRPLAHSNVGRSSGIGGVGGPGEGVLSLAPGGGAALSAGTSVAAAFVTGTAALLWSLFPAATATEIKNALLSSHAGHRRTVVPPPLDAWAAYELLSAARQVRSATL
jgi:subtilisin family serine protease